MEEGRQLAPEFPDVYKYLKNNLMKQITGGEKGEGEGGGLQQAAREERGGEGSYLFFSLCNGKISRPAFSFRPSVSSLQCGFVTRHLKINF
jgi:hypothetical protein